VIQRFGAGASQADESAQRIIENDSGMIENFVKFEGGFGAITGGEISLPTDVGGIQSALVKLRWSRQVERLVDGERGDGVIRFARLQIGFRANRGQPIFLNKRVCGIFLVQFIGDGVRFFDLSGAGRNETRKNGDALSQRLSDELVRFC
jgi:hypothetical protein